MSFPRRRESRDVRRLFSMGDSCFRSNPPCRLSPAPRRMKMVVWSQRKPPTCQCRGRTPCRPPQGGRTETSAPTLLGSCAVGVRDDPDYVVSCGCQVPDLTRTGELAAAKPTPDRILLAMTVSWRSPRIKVPGVAYLDYVLVFQQGDDLDGHGGIGYNLANSLLEGFVCLLRGGVQSGDKERLVWP